MNEDRIKEAVLGVLSRTLDARMLAAALGEALPAPSHAEPPRESASPPAPVTSGTHKLLTRIVLGDILDDGILAARPQDRAFPLRLFFSELGTLLADASDDGARASAADQAFTFASGLNFFLRSSMDAEAKVRVGIEVSRQLYVLAAAASLERELVSKAAPLLAAIMSNELERVKLEAVDHARVFDSQVHERTASSDPTSSRILRPASFLARVTANNAVKAKAQVVT